MILVVDKLELCSMLTEQQRCDVITFANGMADGKRYKSVEFERHKKEESKRVFLAQEFARRLVNIENPSNTFFFCLF